MNIGALIPVRLGSERFPRKHLQKIQDRPILHHLLDRIFASHYLFPENVVVCTTDEPENDELHAVVEMTGAKVFRGAKDDIIDRFYCAANTYKFDVIAEIDGDDPCIDTGYLDLCIKTLLADTSLDIVLSSGLPLGIASKVFTQRALKKVHQSYCTKKNDTGFMWYFTKTGLCTVKEIQPLSAEDVHVEARLTLDYIEDFEFFTALFARLYQPGRIFSIREIVALLKQEPELVKINSALNEKFISRTKMLAKLCYKKDGNTLTVE